MAYQLFDSSVVKKQADGDVVLSSYLEDGEELVKSSFHVDPPALNRTLTLTADRATFTASENSFSVNVSSTANYPIIDEILAGKYRHESRASSFTETDLRINDGDIAATFPFVAVFRNAAASGTVDLIFDLSGGTRYEGNPNFEIYPWFSKNLDAHTVLRVETDGSTVITLPTAN